VDPLAVEPLFVDRAAELAHFECVCDDLPRGERRHPRLAFARVDAGT